MASRNQPVRWYWPTLGNVADAVQASNQGMWAAVFCAAVTGLMATISLFTHSGVGGVDPSAYVDAVLFAVIAWRIRARSKAFAVAGLVLFVIEKIYQIAMHPESLRFGIILAVILLLCFISSVRGNFAYHRFMAEATPSGLPEAGGSREV
jgi:hypothetical protein